MPVPWVAANISSISDGPGTRPVPWARRKRLMMVSGAPSGTIMLARSCAALRSACSWAHMIPCTSRTQTMLVRRALAQAMRVRTAIGMSTTLTGTPRMRVAGRRCAAGPSVTR